METRKLNNGVEMPQEGFGVFQVNDPALCEQTVLDAIHTGYRLIDTASSYENEEAVGRAIQRSGVSREELFITTKAYIHQMGYENTIAAFEDSLKKLGLEYLDLYLIHMPFGDYYGSADQPDRAPSPLSAERRSGADERTGRTASGVGAFCGRIEGNVHGAGIYGNRGEVWEDACPGDPPLERAAGRDRDSQNRTQGTDERKSGDLGF